MLNGIAVTARYVRLTAANLIVGIMLCAASAYLVGGFASSLEAGRLSAAAQESLNVQAEALNGALDKYRILPALLGHRPDIATLLEGASGDQAALRRIALTTMGMSGALDVVFLRRSGAVVARGAETVSDTIDPDGALLGAVRQGRLGRDERVLGDGRRAYVFASAVWAAGTIAGIVLVYVDLESIENTWSLINNPILATDATGRVIMSNRPAWRMVPRPDFSEPVRGGAANPIQDIPTDYLARSRALPPLKWTLTVLLQAAPIRWAALVWGGLAAAVAVGLVLLVQTAINRHFAALRRSRSERAISLRLERIVRDRTRELLQTNSSLAHEVAERKAAVDLLRKTQSELVQTGKMAALGQMSTALSHEINQPLSAVKTYAQNALVYLERDRTEEAADNLRRISDLTDRMAEVSRHLRNFARKPNPTFGSTSISKVVTDALMVVAARLREAQVDVVEDLGPPGILVRGGPVRLQQVMVNLVLNALDAMAGERQARIYITVTPGDGFVEVSVRDTGPGIAPDVLPQIFDPFFTTKSVGQGLGLGLSISYNIVKDFGGTLSAHNSPQGGACFVLRLEVGEEDQVAAQ